MQSLERPASAGDAANNSPTESTLTAIVVTFNPEGPIVGRFAILAKQVASFVVVDNGSRLDVLKAIKREAARHNGSVISNLANLGIAVALNQGMEWAIRRGYKWALLLDQDTQIAERTVNLLSNIERDYPSRGTLAIVSANFVDPVTAAVVFKPPAHATGAWFSRVSSITSGSLLSISAYQRIGPFRADFFIDHVDTEFCLRARKYRLEVIVSTAPLMIHSIGTGSVHTFLGIKTRTSNHSAIRRYYIFRNCTVLAKEYWTSEFVFIVRLLLNICKSLILILFYEDAKVTKLRYAFRGIVDGFRGRLGSYEEAAR